MEKKKDSEEAQKAKIAGDILNLKYPTYLDSKKIQPSKLNPFDRYLKREQKRFEKDYTVEELHKIRDEEELIYQGGWETREDSDLWAPYSRAVKLIIAGKKNDSYKKMFAPEVKERCLLEVNTKERYIIDQQYIPINEEGKFVPGKLRDMIFNSWATIVAVSGGCGFNVLFDGLKDNFSRLSEVSGKPTEETEENLKSELLSGEPIDEALNKFIKLFGLTTYKATELKIDALQAIKQTKLRDYYIPELIVFMRKLFEEWSYSTPPFDHNYINGIIEQVAILDKEADFAFRFGFYGIPNNWEYWANKPQLMAEEGIPLMCGMPPDVWRKHETKPFDPSWNDWVESIEIELERSERDGTINQLKTPVEWLKWGRTNGLDKPLLKSNSKLSEPDICLWSLFASAVKRFEDSKPKGHAEPRNEAKEADNEIEKPSTKPVNQKCPKEWSKLKIEIHPKGRLQIENTISGEKWKETAASLGFINKTTGEVNKLWGILFGMAKGKHVASKEKVSVSRVRKLLQEHFQIQSDPFTHDKVDGYRPKFILTEEFTKLDRQAKDKAIHESYNDTLSKHMSSDDCITSNEEEYPYELEDDEADGWLKNNS